MLKEKIRTGEIDTVVIAFTDMQGRLVGKRVTGEYLLRHPDGVHFCVYLLGTDMEMTTPDGFPGMGWEQGYGDWQARPDWRTLRVVPWLDGTAIVLADVFDDANRLVAVAPRTMLRRQLERAAALGFTVQMASELEFYLLNESYESAHRKGYEDLSLAGYYNEDYQLLQGTRNEPLYRRFRNLLTRADIPVECTKGEAGIGQHEINIEYCEALEAADRHVLLKHGLKEMALQSGMAVTFMSKPSETWTGSSSHIHLSLWDQAGRNAFSDPASSLGGMSRVMQQFLAGVMTHLRDLALLFAPNINSYKRFAKGSWAPTRIVWGWDNRTCGLRIVGRGESLRIENRFPGADANPYLAYTAFLAAGLDGIERGLTLPPAWGGNGYETANAPALPGSLREAIQVFAESRFAQEVLGPEVHAHYLNAARVEQEAFDRVVTNWERSRYFERG
ncbi:MAG: glutamine synthetase family protein [Alicyclobacillus sp.]|nr:glutamine synthetase family protein [Alicyclobacillus sp.]